MREELTEARGEVTQTSSLAQKHKRMCRSFLQDETRDFVGVYCLQKTRLVGEVDQLQETGSKRIRCRMTCIESLDWTP